MKVVDITTFYSTGRGGITTYLERKAQLSQRVAGVEHALILGGPRDETSNFHGSVCHWIKSKAVGWNPHYRYLLNYFKIRRAIAALQPDVIETSDPYWIPLYLTRIRKTLGLHQTRLFLFYRVDYPDTYVLPFIDKYLPWLHGLAQRLSWWLVRCVLNRMDGILVHSDVMAEKLQRHGVRVPTHVVGNLTNIEAFIQAQPNPEIQRTLTSRFAKVGPRLLFCGRLSHEKGLERLLDVYGSMLRQDAAFRDRQPVLIVIGDGPLRSRVANLAADARQRLHFIPATSDRFYLASIFAACDLMVMPGPFETFSMVTLEAISCGLPVVGIRGTGGIRALIRPGVGFLCEHDDADEMALNIRRALAPKADWYLEQVRQEIVSAYEPRQVYAHLLKAYGKPAAPESAALVAQASGRM